MIVTLKRQKACADRRVDENNEQMQILILRLVMMITVKYFYIFSSFSIGFVDRVYSLLLRIQICHSKLDTEDLLFN